MDEEKMDLKLFKELMKRGPSQHPPEWEMFLKICDMYLKERKIESPVVVELGTNKNRQKKFWIQLFDAEHIGIDSSLRRNTPDITGDTHDPKTLEALKNKLKGRAINILFIDAGHSYDSVKEDFETYSPLCSDIIALHDIETGRYWGRGGDVWKFWDEMKEESYIEQGRYEHFLFMEIRQCRFRGLRHKRMGIGMVIIK